MSFAMPQIPWRRPDQFGNFMRVLKFGTIDLDNGARVAKQNLCGRFHYAGFPRSGRPEKQQVPHRAAWRIQSGAKDLVQVHQRLDALFLSDNFPSQRGLKIDGVRAAFAGVEWQDSFVHDRLLANPRRRVRVAESHASTAKLVQLDLKGGLQKPQLHKQLPRHHGGFRNPEKRRKQVRQFEIESSKRGNKFLDRGRVGICQVHLAVQLFAQRLPVQLHEGMLFGNLANQVIGDSGVGSEPRQMQLAHLSAAAHIVHQVERIPFAADKSHDVTSDLPCSVILFHYTLQY